jgi:glycosyltransferase involved in cell wall biosynthesis
MASRRAVGDPSGRNVSVDMRVLWTHNFDPAIASKGSFMHAAAAGLRARGVELHLEYLGNLRSPAQISRARERVKRLARDFDLVHAQFGSACALVTGAADGVPKVLTLRGSDWHTYDRSLNFLYVHTRLASRFTRLALRSYACIICVSRRIAAQVAPLAPQAAIAVLPSPVELSRFVRRDKRQAKALFGHRNGDEKWVLFNSLDLRNPVKRFDLAQAAFDLAQARLGNLRLRLATNLPHEDMASYVAACDLILCTSLTEGWPNSVKEALACDVPFVATDVSDLREIASVEPSCRVCEPDAGVIADNICSVLTSQESAGLRKHVLHMDVAASTEQLLVLYHNALAGPVNGDQSLEEASQHPQEREDEP